MAQRRVVVGTTPVILANYRDSRIGINISMPPTSVVAANTGVVYVRKGFPPSSDNTGPNSGDPLTQGSQFTDTSQFDDDPALFKGQYWAIADTAAQVVIVDEVTRR